MSNISRIVEMLEAIQKGDKKFLAKMDKKHGAATFCVECHRNTFTGRHPFWHRYPRSLCDQCSRTYDELLDRLGARDK